MTPGAFVGALLVLAGCAAPILYQPTGKTPASVRPRPAASVQVLWAYPPNFVQIGKLEAGSDTLAIRPDSEDMDRMKTRAGEIGCEAIVMGGAGTSMPHWEAACILFAAPPGTPGGLPEAIGE